MPTNGIRRTDVSDRAWAARATAEVRAAGRFFHYALVLLGVAWATPSPAVAQAVIDAPLDSLTVENWGMEAGLASHWVRDIAEDKDGLLWVVSHGGLSRFDGRRFAASLALQTPSPLGDTLSQIERTRDGRLWVGLEHGGVRVLTRDSIESPPTALRIPADAGVHDLAADDDGSLWVGTGKGLWRLSASGSAELALGGRIGSPIAAVAHRNGTTWVRTRAHGLWRIHGNVARRLSEPQSECDGRDVAAGRTVLVTACSDGAWRQDLRTGEWVRLPVEPGISLIFVDRRDRVWFGTSKGVVRMHGQRQELRAFGPVMADARLRAFHEDVRGDVWLGSFSEGAARLHVAEARLLGEAEGLSTAPTTSVLGLVDGTVLSGAFREGLLAWHPQRGRTGHWRRQDGLPGDTVWALARDDGRDGVWVGGDEGLRWLSSGKLQSAGPGDLRFPGRVRVVYVDPLPPHAVWVSGGDGAYALGQGTTTRYGAEQGLDIGQVRFFQRRRDGRLVAGGVNGLFVFTGTRWRRVSAPPLHLRALTTATEDPAGTLWMTGDLDGLVRWRSGAAVPEPKTWAAPFSPVHSLVAEGSGALWASGNEGLARIVPPSIDTAGVAPAILRLGRREGLDRAETNGWGWPSAWKTLDGTLLYPAVNGVIRLDPSTLRQADAGPRAVLVQHVRIAGGTPRAPDDVVLDTDQRSLALALSAIEFQQPESVQFRYQLEGFDADWVPAGPTREAAYPKLAGGRYRFRLQARIGAGPWVEGDAVAVTVTPRWYEYRVVQGIGLLLVAVAIGGWAMRRQRTHARHLAQSQHARDFLRSVIDAHPHPLFVRHPDGRFVLANAALSRLYGRKPDELETEASLASLDGHGFDVFDRMHARVLATGEAQEEPMVEVVDAAGFRHWLHVAMRPFRQRGDRGVEEVIGAAEDITDTVVTRAGLEERERLLKLSREEARDLAGRLLDAQEQERRAIARELHDDYTQRLAGLAMMAWSTQRQIGPEGKGAIGELAIELECIAKQMQQASRELHPPELEGIGLVEALRLACRMFGHRSGLDVAFSMEGEDVALPEPVALAAYRIVQQALQNTLSHAGTREARLSIRREPRSLAIEVVDAGRGFDPAAADATPGLGLASMRERARLAGIALTLHSSPGDGTRVLLVVPVP